MIPNQWYAILESRELGRKKPLKRTRLGEQMVVWRDGQGRATCMQDLCPHRGAALSQGEIVSDRLACPFHGFEFDGQGACQHIPANSIASRPPRSFQVRAYPTREAHNLIWIFWAPADSPLPDDDQLPPLPFFEDLDTSFFYATIRDPWRVHYSRAIENQLDVVHLPFVHRTTIGRGRRTVVDGPVIRWDPADTLNVWVYNRADDGRPAVKPSGMPEPQGTVQLQFRLPHIWQNRISDDLRIFIAFVPVDEENCILYMRFYQRFMRLPLLRSLVSWAGIWSSLYIAWQDKRVVLNQRPVKTDLRMGEKLIPGDNPIVAYRRRRADLIDGAGTAR